MKNFARNSTTVAKMRLLGEMFKLSNINLKPNLLPNPNFDTNVNGWTAYVNGGSFTLPLFVWETGKARIDPQGTYANTGIMQSAGITLKANTNYQITWKARAASNTTMNIYVETPDNQSSGNIFNVTLTESSFTYNFLAVTATTTAKVYFRTAEPTTTNTTLWLDDVSLVEL